MGVPSDPYGNDKYSVYAIAKEYADETGEGLPGMQPDDEGGSESDVTEDDSDDRARSSQAYNQSVCTARSLPLTESDWRTWALSLSNTCRSRPASTNEIRSDLGCGSHPVCEIHAVIKHAHHDAGGCRAAAAGDPSMISYNAHREEIAAAAATQTRTDTTTRTDNGSNSDSSSSTDAGTANP